MEIITIKRAGKFTVKEADEHQCGVYGQETYHYKAAITGLRTQVNKYSDFLIDNAEIHDYFLTQVKAVSCELMVTRAAKGLRQLCILQGFKPKKIVVEIIANDSASCVCELT